MIERYVFIKLRDEFSTPAGRAEVAAEAERVLPSIPGVGAVRVGLPADEHAMKAWDVSLTIRFASADEAERYREHPEHRHFVDAFLAPRMALVKAWNMELR